MSTCRRTGARSQSTCLDQYTNRHTTLRNLDAHPDARFPGAGLRRHIQMRDRTCIAPGCRRPARTVEQDHTREHAHGGPTVRANLDPLCRRHHRRQTPRRLDPDPAANPAGSAGAARWASIYWTRSHTHRTRHTRTHPPTRPRRQLSQHPTPPGLHPPGRVSRNRDRSSPPAGGNPPEPPAPDPRPPPPAGRSMMIHRSDHDVRAAPARGRVTGVRATRPEDVPVAERGR